MSYRIDNMASLNWVNANKIKFKKLEEGKKHNLYLLIINSLIVVTLKVNFAIYYKVMSLFALIKDTPKGWVSFNELLVSC